MDVGHQGLESDEVLSCRGAIVVRTVAQSVCNLRETMKAERGVELGLVCCEQMVQTRNGTKRFCVRW